MNCWLRTIGGQDKFVGDHLWRKERSKMARISTVLYVVIALGLPPLANSEIKIDGCFNPDQEEYTIGYNVNLNVEGVDLVDDMGQLWYHYDYDPQLKKKCLSVVFVQPLTLVDNSYGANSIGWGQDAPSEKNHNFKDLKGSDKARFTIADDSGNVVFDFTLDYISEIDQDEGKGKDKGTGAYGSLGVAGGDGEVHSGDADALLAWGTSLDYNFNSLGHVLTQDSPATDPDYENSEFPGWVFEVMYEFRIDGDVLGGYPLGGVTIPIVHDSPNKIGNNKVHPEIGELIEVEDGDCGNGHE